MDGSATYPFESLDFTATERRFNSYLAEFFAMAVVVGLVQGGVQSLSRSFFGRLVPPGKGAEFFGFYNMVGKFGTVIGPRDASGGWRRTAVGDPTTGTPTDGVAFGGGKG